MLHIFARKYYITAFDANKLPWIAILGRELAKLSGQEENNFVKLAVG